MRYTRLVVFATALVGCAAEPDRDDASLALSKGPTGWETYRRLDQLPLLAHGVQSRELSAFDRDNGNEDGFGGVYSCLRTTSAGCLIAEDRGAGEITSIWFTQINQSNDGIPDEGDVRPTGRIKIELDGTTVVDRSLQDVVNGRLGAPFVYPLVANADQSSGGVYIKVPMAYRTQMRVWVQNNPRFYHVNYRQFPDATAVTTFDPNDQAMDVIASLQDAGIRDPKPPRPGATTTAATVTVAAGQTLAAAQRSGPGAISELRLRFPGVASQDVLARVRLQIEFDGYATVDAPIGELFGSGLGVATVRSLMFSMSTAPGGWYTMWWPMPFRQSATVKLVNTTGAALTGVELAVTSAPDAQWLNALGPGGTAGYFTAIARAGATVPREDWLLADVTGRGKLVGVVQTMRGANEGNMRGYLEGDERVYVDGSLTPQWHGTGTEDFYEAGWYFARGTFSAPFVGNTRHEVRTANCPFECDATYRLLIADAIPYRSSLRFGIEHGPNNDAIAHYGSTAFLYTRPDFAMRRTDVLDVTDATSRSAHAYDDGNATASELLARYEGDTGEMVIPGRVRASSGTITFELAIDPDNQGVLLRRTGDQANGFQSATISVDGTDVGTWLQPRANAFARWLGDDVALPASATAGKSRIAIAIHPDVGAPAWTAARYTADCLTAARGDSTTPSPPTGLRVVGGRRHALWLTWTEPFDDTSIAYYKIYAATTASVPIEDAYLVGTSRTVGFVHGPLPSRATRHYRVVAVDAAGHASPPSQVFMAQTRAATNSVDGDGRTDLVTFTRGSDADVYVATSMGNAFATGAKRHDYFAVNAEVPAIGDFDGDGRDDIVTFTRGNAADVYVALSNGSGFGPGAKWHDVFAVGDEVPAVGDFNGDGRDDIVTFTRGDNADVFVALSTGTGFGPGIKWNDHFAIGVETPAIGDFDGDGRDDIVTFTRGNAADVYVALSDGSRFIGGDFGVTQKWHDYFALDGEITGAGDFDGDGRDDIITFTRGNVADVYVAYSTGTSFGPGTKIHDSFAGGDELPGIGDFDGDGRDDLVTFTRGDAADVYVVRSTASGFGPAVKWNDFFAVGAEWPAPSLLLP